MVRKSAQFYTGVTPRRGCWRLPKADYAADNTIGSTAAGANVTIADLNEHAGEALVSELKEYDFHTSMYRLLLRGLSIDMMLLQTNTVCQSRRDFVVRGS
jgi:hypothetical protein